MRKTGPKSLFLAGVLGLLLAACGGGDSGTDTGGGTPGGGNPPGSGTPPTGGTGGNTGGGGTGGSPTGSASLSWLAPAENTDGSTVTNLAGYHIYRGTSPDAMKVVETLNSPGITSYVVENLPSGTHYFAVSAYNTSNAESERSPTASKTIP